MNTTPQASPPSRSKLSVWAVRDVLTSALALAIVGWLTGAMDGAQSALNNDSLPFYHGASLRPRWDRWSSWQRTTKFSLTDHRGRAFDERALEDRPTVVGFFYAGCISVCPISIEMLRRLDNALHKIPSIATPNFLLLTVTPEFDTPKALADYAQRLRLPDNWTLATGKPGDMHNLAASLVIDIRLPAAGGEPPHAQRALLLDSKRRIRGVYDASSALEMMRMAGDYRRLALEEKIVARKQLPVLRAGLSHHQGNEGKLSDTPDVVDDRHRISTLSNFLLSPDADLLQ